MQLDEKWSFVEQKEKNAPPERNERCGDNWDHVALDPEHRLVLVVVNGKRSGKNIRKALVAVKRIMAGRTPRLITSDEYRAYKDELLRCYIPKRTGFCEDASAL